MNVFELGFGTGLNALLTAVEAMVMRRKIYYITIEPEPLEPEMARVLNYNDADGYLQKMHEAPWGIPVAIHPCFTFTKYRSTLADFDFNIANINHFKTRNVVKSGNQVEQNIVVEPGNQFEPGNVAETPIQIEPGNVAETASQFEPRSVVESTKIGESGNVIKAGNVVEPRDVVSTGPVFDLVYFDAFGPLTQPELWSADSFTKIASIMKTGAVLTTYCSKSVVRKTMAGAGLQVKKIQGPYGKREMVRATK
jgi:hypothetical protein